MILTGLHFLLTYQCTFECDHCFVWGSPWQSGTMTLDKIRNILGQAKEMGGVERIYFEGGEPFLFYPVLLEGVRQSAGMGFSTGIVTNVYWATSEEDARAYLNPFVGLIDDLTISSDLYHFSELNSLQTRNARAAAEALGIPIGTICVAQPDTTDSDQGALMYRGRAAEKLASRSAPQAWNLFTRCPHEDLREPGRVHVDPFGNIHICQGIKLGNVFETSLAEICSHYAPESYPIIRPLLAGGPAALVTEYALPHAEAYADACHLCYVARLAMRSRFPEVLGPDQMYGTNLGDA